MAWPGIDQWLGGPHEAELMPMSWDELRRLAEAGWEIGSHSRTHPMLTQLDDQSVAQRACRLSAGVRRGPRQALQVGGLPLRRP